jgi:hypothetical protein
MPNRFDASVAEPSGRVVRFMLSVESASFAQTPAHGVSFNSSLTIPREPQAVRSGLSVDSPEPLSNHPLTR